METYNNIDSPAAVADFSERAKQTADSASETLKSSRQTARAALDTGRSFATGAVNAAGQKLVEVKGQVEGLTKRTTRYTAEKPMQALAITAAASFVFALVLSGLRRNR